MLPVGVDRLISGWLKRELIRLLLSFKTFKFIEMYRYANIKISSH